MDIWSIGVILYLLVTGGADDCEQRMHKEHFDFREGIWDDIDETFRDFVEEMV